MTMVLAPPPALAPGEFVSGFGHVAYREVCAKGAMWRADYVAKYPGCEFPGCPVDGDFKLAILVFDHCHGHGWVRGAICAGHNVRLGRIEAVIGMPGITVDLGDSEYGRYIARCPGCSGAAAMPSKGAFRPVFMSPAVKTLVQQGRLPEPENDTWLTAKEAAQLARNLRADSLRGAVPVARRRFTKAHLAVADAATACGLVAHGMVPAPHLPLCRVCDQAQRA